jgi:hypothetical protein
MSRSIETVLIVLWLAARAAAHKRMSGHVAQINTAHRIRARFRPRVPFTITQATMSYCGHERISSNFLRMGDAVMVKFRTRARMDRR